MAQKLKNLIFIAIDTLTGDMAHAAKDFFKRFDIVLHEDSFPEDAIKAIVHATSYDRIDVSIIWKTYLGYDNHTLEFQRNDIHAGYDLAHYLLDVRDEVAKETGLSKDWIKNFNFEWSEATYDAWNKWNNTFLLRDF